MTEDRDSYFLFDASSLIDLLGGQHPPAKTSDLRKLAKTARLRMPAAVARELSRGSHDDPVKAWANSEAGHRCTVPETGEIVNEIGRLVRVYSNDFTTKPGAADPAVVATALKISRDGHAVTVVSADTGVQTVCYKEGLVCIGTSVFLQLRPFEQ